MSAAAPKPVPFLLLICGDDEFAVKRRAKEVFQRWSEELGGMDHELIDATVTNSGEARKVIGRLREALQTLPFFGSGKAIWLKDCNFLADERHATGEVTELLADLAQEFKSFAWGSVRLLISAGKVDKRKVFYKTIDKTGRVELCAGWAEDKDWMNQAEAWARKALRERGKEIADEALSEMLSRVGPNPRQLESEVEKVALYVGENLEVSLDDVVAVCTRNKAARAFALGDALGERDLPRLLKRLDEELWEVKLDPQKSEIGLLYGLISKVRAMLLAKELVREGWVKQDADYARFRAQLERLPPDRLPEDKKFNPRSINPFVLYNAARHARGYTTAELVAAMDLLLQCNQRLVSTGADQALVLQQTLVQIATRNATKVVA